MRPGRGRVLGVDAARAVALLAMALAHMHATTTPDGGATAVGAAVAGRASALFAVLAGVGVALSTTRVRDRRDHAGAAAGLVTRGLCLALLGLGLEQLLGRPPAIILAQYGLLFVVAALLVRLSAVVCFAAAAGWCALSPVLSHLLRAGGPAEPGPQPDLAMLLGDPGELLGTLTLTGYYPVLTWITYLLVGIGVGRLDLRAPRTPVRLVVAGAALAAVALASSALLRAAGLGPAGVDAVRAQTQRAGTTPPGDWGWLVVSGRHTGTAFDLAHTVGSSLVVLGVALLLARVPARPIALPVAVLAATGSASLTLYTGHIVLTGAFGLFGTPAWVLQAAAALAVGAALLATGRRGPLEAAVGRVSRVARRAAAGTPAVPDGAAADDAGPDGPAPADGTGPTDRGRKRIAGDGRQAG
ncbi:MAG TPA: heparan-alpha-glucosaminide N-acetyltransferase domain-containing protein [Pseudonocardia sp.]|nr:heparan-alpha-glucosaminide N-acetyltransferase domain-containing protein [Pseudonocardia sp.]